MFQNYLKWRRESSIANPPLPTVDGQPLQTCVRGFKTVPDGDWDINHPLTPEKFRKFYPNMGGGCFHKFAKDGMPIFIERTGLHDVKGLAVNCSEETMIDWHVRNQEVSLARWNPFPELLILRNAALKSLSIVTPSVHL